MKKWVQNHQQKVLDKNRRGLPQSSVIRTRPKREKRTRRKTVRDVVTAQDPDVQRKRKELQAKVNLRQITKADMMRDVNALVTQVLRDQGKKTYPIAVAQATSDLYSSESESSGQSVTSGMSDVYSGCVPPVFVSASICSDILFVVDTDQLTLAHGHSQRRVKRSYSRDVSTKPSGSRLLPPQTSHPFLIFVMLNNHEPRSRPRTPSSTLITLNLQLITTIPFRHFLPHNFSPNRLLRQTTCNLFLRFFFRKPRIVGPRPTL